MVARDTDALGNTMTSKDATHMDSDACGQNNWCFLYSSVGPDGRRVMRCRRTAYCKNKGCLSGSKMRLIALHTTLVPAFPCVPR